MMGSSECAREAFLGFHLAQQRGGGVVLDALAASTWPGSVPCTGSGLSTTRASSSAPDARARAGGCLLAWHPPALHQRARVLLSFPRLGGPAGVASSIGRLSNLLLSFARVLVQTGNPSGSRRSSKCLMPQGVKSCPR